MMMYAPSKRSIYAPLALRNNQERDEGLGQWWRRWKRGQRRRRSSCAAMVPIHTHSSQSESEVFIHLFILIWQYFYKDTLSSRHAQWWWWWIMMKLDVVLWMFRFRRDETIAEDSMVVSDSRSFIHYYFIGHLYGVICVCSFSSSRWYWLIAWFIKIFDCASSQSLVCARENKRNYDSSLIGMYVPI